MDEITNDMKRLQVQKRQLIKRMKEKITERETETEGEEASRRKPKPKIISNIQLVPPRNPGLPKGNKEQEKENSEWKTVTGKKRGRVKERRNMQGKNESNKRNRKQQQQQIRKPPRTAAVTITAGEGLTYADILRQAREKISLPDIGIERSRIRKSINGGLIIEIPGNDGTQKANELARKLQEVLPENTRVRRPTIRSDMRISGLDESVTKEEIQLTVADVGGCHEDEVRAGEIRWRPDGLGTIWIRWSCPLSTANKIAETNKIKIG